MNTQHTKIKKLLKKKLSLKKIIIKGFEKNIEIIAIGEIFLNLKTVQREKIIYFPLMKYFQNNDIHSICIQTYTLQEWKKYKKNHYL
ncbi:BolA family transcriptional regulator [Buchnera aphidicola]|uniref:BolA family transcriptional regulator n=1 Tax=Buchnera aphidicola TaxID=9 RepID=UPI0031B69AD8